MARRQGNDYFRMFVEQADYACKAANYLSKIFHDFDAAKLPEQMKKMHEIEHDADIAKHTMVRKLIKEFMPPIDREDIMQLAQQLDDVTDSIEDVLLRVYIYHIEDIHQDAIQFAELITQCCDELKKTMQEFHNFKKSSSIHSGIIEVNRLEEVADDRYTEFLRKLFANRPDPLEAHAWAEIYDYFEKCCDACEDVTDTIESVILKNS